VNSYSRPMAVLTAGVLAVVPLTLVYTAGASPTAESKTTAAPILWKDLDGRAYSSSDSGKARATVFFFSSSQCPISNIYTPRMIEMAKAYTPRGVRFFLVNSNADDTLPKLKQYIQERAFPFPAVKDTGTALADRLGARVTPETIIVSSDGNIQYRGRIDDNKDRTKVVRKDAQAALDEVLAGQPVKFPRTLSVGCAIFRDRVASPAKIAGAAYTYSKDIAPILNANCVACHRSGEVAPFALESYAQAKTWAGQIKDYTTRKLMPPWKAAVGYGEFHDERVLTDKQIGAIAAWADSGAPQGDPKLTPALPRFPNPNEWSLGKPDVIVQPVRAYHLEPEGLDVYRNFVLPVDFTEDKYVSAMEFKPGNRAVVHHIVAYLDLTGGSVKMDGKEKEPGYSVPGVGIGVFNAQWGEVWVPGRTPRFMPPGIGVKIPRGAKIVMQVHYHKNGAPQTDTSQMALYYAKDKVERTVQVIPVFNYAFALTPGNKRQVVTGSFTLPTDVHLRAMFPHMHLLGKEMKVTATLPDGTKKPLIYVNDWDFNWQETYEYKEPMALPKGTRIDMEAIYDNSESNPHQMLHPPKLITFGEQTTDEMCFAFMTLTFDKPFSRARNIDPGAP
jgi:mono/diheme cytochrome c family protein